MSALLLLATLVPLVFVLCGALSVDYGKRGGL